ncbi:major facilitator superfamily transporter allantoate [Aspergillus ibericus CBS 121593]|uniref:Major facilitator superfamily transporter allantoate n=1 Tax=Aspergillus ibericus CBS 121593 TaxID=1448316 RepID=A0A395H4S8_9EURO|nr:major facilitator superfamily transporter allantoate [Aspergillus ibericus CBS 121593]RAL02670.1 major facilitator superfamily transporter allantoate [Aspergillus ibericus CBS 121593]
MDKSASRDEQPTKADLAAGEIIESPAVDPALLLTGGTVVEFTPEEERQLLRKIDRHMLPLLCWVYLIQFADKTTLNYASLMGLQTDTGLHGNQYNWVSSIFYAGYLAWEFPTTYFLRRLPVGKYTAANILCWGVALAGHAAASNYGGLLACRFLLGAFEATVTPAFVLITGMWYRQNEQGRRMGYWLSCNGGALILMSVIGYGLSAIDHAALAPWRILFLLLGLLTILTGIAYLWYLPDSQATARFLTDRERLVALERIRDNFQGVGSPIWKWAQFREAFHDPRTYLYILYSLLMNIPNGGITTFGSLLIKSFGFGDRLALLLSAPSGLFDIAGKLLFTWLSDHWLDRTAVSFAAIMVACLGGILMVVLPDTAKPALLIGYYLVSVAGASWGLLMTAISNNTLGYTKKVTVSGLQIIAYAAGNWIGPQTFPATEAPEYRRGKLLVAIMYGLAGAVLLLLRFVNGRENRRRDRLQVEAGIDLANDEVARHALERSKFMDLTDFQQLHFRYVL